MDERDTNPVSPLKIDAPIAIFALLLPLLIIYMLVLVVVLALGYAFFLPVVSVLGENSLIVILVFSTYPLLIIGLPTRYFANVLFDSSVFDDIRGRITNEDMGKVRRWIRLGLWWIGLPTVLLTVLARDVLGYIQFPVTGLGLLVTNAVYVYVGLTVVTRLYRLFVSFHDGRSPALEFALAYPFVAGLIDIVASSLLGMSSVQAMNEFASDSGSEFDSDTEFGFVWVYIWLVAVVEIARVLQGTETEDPGGSSVLLFNGETGNGMSEAMTIGYIVLPVLVIALPLVVSARRAILEKVLQIGRFGASLIGNILFLRPRS